jgi:hypothetical protein
MNRVENEADSNYPRWLPFALAGVFFLLSITMIVLSPGKYIYDEVYYYQYATDLAKKGMGLEYLRELIAPPGPLHGVVHYGLSWATGLRPIPMRLVTNVVFLMVGVCASLLMWRVRRLEACYGVALLYAIPFAGVIFGVSLTESSAMLAATLATLLAVMGGQALHLGTREADLGFRGKWIGYGLMAVSGLLYATSVWGRQNYLLVLPALPLLFINSCGFAWRPWALVTLLGYAGAFLLFGIWGGLVPEAVRFVSVGGGDREVAGSVAGLNILFGIRSLAYAALAFVVLTPGVFRREWRLVFSCVAMALFGCLIFEPMRFLPSAYLVSRFLGDTLLVPVSIVCGSGFAFFGFWLFASICWNCLDLINSVPQRSFGASVGFFDRVRCIGWNEKLYLFGAAAWMLILASNMKISHQFSSRYVVVAAPFLLITAIFHFRATSAAHLRLICGFIVSMLLLANYYQWFN